MIRRTTALDGRDWRIRPHPGTDAALAAAVRPSASTEPGWLPAAVPGTILDDLWRAGEVPDPYHGRNSLLVEWVPGRAWTYVRTFDAPPLAPGERAWLRFEGVDHAGHVFLDGSLVGSHEGMFRPFAIEIGERIRDGGRHELAVVIDPAPPDEPQVGRTSKVRIHKARMTYGWDFCPRLVHQGLWRSVALETAGSVRIEDVRARPILSPDLRTGTVEVEVRVGAVGDAGWRAVAELADPSGAIAASVETRPGDGGSNATVARLRLDVIEPRLWWPNGLGPADLHRLTVRLYRAARADSEPDSEPGDEPADERVVSIGFRRIEQVSGAGAPADARPWVFVVNGRTMPIHGWNWCPVDALYGVPRPDHVAHLLRLAASGHANLLRVWGGGLIESEAFYDECDRLGILVWQEFSQSSSGLDNTPATDPAFVALMTDEAEAIVPLRRHHPSLAIWCGGNELTDIEGRPLDDGHPVLAALHDVVARLDPDRIWLPTSPSGPRFHNRLGDIENHPDELHDVHGPWEHQGLRAQTELYDRGTSLFNSEFGVEGMANRRTHERLIGPDHREPADRSNPVYRHLGDWWNNAELVADAFGGRLVGLEQLRKASQRLQADGLRVAIEANRRRWPRNAGSLPWQLNESYPNAWCTAVIDHRGDPKPAFHAATRAFGPIVVTARLPGLALDGADRLAIGVWAWSEHEPLAGATVRLRIVGMDGTIHLEADEPIDLPDGQPVEVGRGREIALDDRVGGLFFVDLALRDAVGVVRASNRYLLSRGPDLRDLVDLPAATVDIATNRDVDCWRLDLAHSGGPAAIGVTVSDGRDIESPGWAEADDGGFDLLPGERRTIAVRWADAGTGDRVVELEGFNVERVVVR